MSEAQRRTSQPLLGSFEESLLYSRLQPIRTVEGYRAEVRTSGARPPYSSLLRVTFFSADQTGGFPYLGHVHLSHRGYKIPKKGTLQVTIFNPLDRVDKLFLLTYDLSDMPPCSQTFLRQRTRLVPLDSKLDPNTAREPLSSRSMYFIQCNIVSSKCGRVYLNKDLRILVSKRLDLETSLRATKQNYELRSFEEMPNNPRYFAR